MYEAAKAELDRATNSNAAPDIRRLMAPGARQGCQKPVIESVFTSSASPSTRGLTTLSKFGEERMGIHLAKVPTAINMASP
jgi:hypothetical protein